MILGPLLVTNAIADIMVSPSNRACSDVTGTPFCSVTAAIQKAPPNSVIRLEPHHYMENLVVDKSLTIVGAQRSDVVIDGGGRDPVFRINPVVNVNLENMTVTNGHGENGGGIYNQGKLTLRNCTISDNIAELSGGGIFSGGSMSSELSIEQATIANNVALGNDAYNIKYGGGGIFSDAPLRISNTEIRDNQAMNSGGGIYSVFTRRREASLVEQLTEQTGIATPPPKQKMLLNLDNARAMVLRNVRIRNNRAANGGGLHVVGSADIRNSTLSGNAADRTPTSSGGGIFAHFSAQLKLVNVDVSSNLATSRGGGIRYFSINPSELHSTTIVANAVKTNGRGAGLFVQDGSAKLEISHSIIDRNIAGNGRADDCSGSITSAGGNFVRGGSLCISENRNAASPERLADTR